MLDGLPDLAAVTVVLANGHVITAGDQYPAGTYYGDVWRSIDNCTTFQLMNAAAFSGRFGLMMAVGGDGHTIYVMAGSSMEQLILTTCKFLPMKVLPGYL